MLTPRLTDCPECADIPNLLKKIDCKLAEYANGLYNNVVFMLNQIVPAGAMIQLLAYKRILTYKQCNPDYLNDFCMDKIVSKVIRLTLGCDIRPIFTPTPTSSTTSTTSSTSSTTTTTTTAVISYSFVSTWNTANTRGGSNADQIQLPLGSTGTYNFTVDWGDGTTDTITSYNQAETLHTYASSGTYTLTIDGIIEGFSFWDYFVEGLKIISIDNWGVFRLADYIGGGYFSSCENLDLSLVSDILDLAGITNLSFMFEECYALTTINNVNYWDVSSVTDMNNMFYFATSFNQPLNSWNVSSVQNMDYMFYYATAFNGNISSWDVSNVTNMLQMFYECTSFNQPLNLWNVSSVTNMGYMFSGATSFNQPIDSWDVSSVTDMSAMFYNATSFNQPLNSWNVSSVTNMSGMFYGATAFNGDISSWNVSSVTDMNNMFYGATAFNQSIGSWNVINVNNLLSFMNGKSTADYSSAYLDAIYNSWSLLTLQPSVNADFGTIQYTVAGSAGRAILTSAPNNWSINDGGLTVSTTSTTSTSTSSTSTSSTTTTTTTNSNPCPECTTGDVQIGDQLWSSCNLDVETYNDGTPIPQVTDPTAWAGLTTGAWCYYNNNSVNGCTYGKLYNWYAVHDTLHGGLAPTGYHIPTDTEWTILTNYIGEGSADALKEQGQTHWAYPSYGTNLYGFTALPSGYRLEDGSFTQITYHSIFWTSTQYNATNVWGRKMLCNYYNVTRINYNKVDGFSVRVIKN